MNELPPLQPEERVRRRSNPVRLIWLMIAFVLTAIAFVIAPEQERPEPTQLSQHFSQPSEPLAGSSAEIYDLARPATLKLELRSTQSLFRPSLLGLGTGFFISPDGLVLTAHHVADPPNMDPSLRGNTQIVGTGPDGDNFELELIGFDAYLDLALLQANVDGEVPYIPIAESMPRIGHDVVAIGNSRGDFLEGRTGQVTRLGVEAQRADFASGTIELTAPLAPGDSGGPVLNSDGAAVGVVSYISYTPGGSSGNGFVPPFLRGLDLPNRFASYAVPVTQDSDVLAAMRAGERRDVPVIGFTWEPGLDYSPRTRGPHDLGPRPGVIIKDVQLGGPADQAGLRGLERLTIYNDGGEPVDQELIADVVTAIDGQATPTFYELLAVVRSKEIGQAITLTVQRGGETINLELELGARSDVFRQR